MHSMQDCCFQLAGSARALCRAVLKAQNCLYEDMRTSINSSQNTTLNAERASAKTNQDLRSIPSTTASKVH